MRRVNVDRMRRYRERTRRSRILPRSEAWAMLIDECGLSSVFGPFPLDPDETLPLRAAARLDVQDWQRWHGLLPDGILGPQTWVALARYNDQVRAI